ncbi:MAG: Com family DNA-binding transcriptional regulator [Burkholderiaceae bacterium]|nr:Com family DNA-binding transcriptional regulator [Burkholderiaceae bacterium]
MQEIRCGKCHKKLAEGEYRQLCIKCHRCKTMNHLSASSDELERQGASLEANNNDKSDYPVARW